MSNYVWILFSLIVALSGAFVYLRYAVPKYQISGYILVGGGALESSTNNILANVGMIGGVDNTASAISNEMFILQSHIINGKVVDSLKLDVIVTTLGRFKDQPILKDSLPVIIKVYRQDRNKQSPLFKLTLKPNNFVISDENNNYKGSYGKPLIISSDTILLSKKVGVNVKENEYTFQLANRLSTVKKYISRLTVEPAKNGGMGLLKLSVIDELPSQAFNYVQALIVAYNQSYLDYKNQAVKRALLFLGDRLKTVSSELREQENEVKNFKANNQLYDVSSAAGELLENLHALDTRKSENEYQEQLLALVETGIKKYSGNEELVATTSGLQDAVLSSQVTKYNDLVYSKQLIVNSSTSLDPRLEPLNSQLEDLRSSILKNIENIRNQFKAGKNYVSSEESKFTNRFQLLPEKERQYVELNRKLGIKENQYLFLLQKKEETEIQLVSSDIERSRTVDDVMNDGMIYPMLFIIYGMAIFLGLIIPIVIIWIKITLNQKIETKKEIEVATNVPIIGELNHTSSKDPITITTNDRSAIAEQFRSVRANLTFMGANDKVFVVTSATSGEGKSFVSLNLANSMAISDKKVAILELDLRKPMLTKKLGITNKVGISNFIVTESLQPQEIIKPIVGYNNLYLLNSGPIPPNPGELMIHSRMKELIDYLRDNFDYVILDSPPIGLVADSLSLAKLSDLSIFVIRPNYSLRSSLHLINDLQKSEKLPKLSLIINGIQKEKGYGGRNEYGHGYGYYSDDIETESKLKKMLDKIFKHS